MEERQTHWLRWVGKLYRDIIDSDQPADAVITASMRVEGRRWGHDARRWVSATAYSLSRSRVRTLWFWAAGVLEFEPLRQLLLSRGIGAGASGGGAGRGEEHAGGSAGIEVAGSYDENAGRIAGGIVGPGSLNVGDAASLGVLPARYAEAAKGTSGATFPDIPEVCVAWAIRRAGSPVDLLAASFNLWTAPAEPMEVLSTLAEGWGVEPDEELFRLLPEWAARCNAQAPTDGSETESIAWTYSLPLWLAGRWSQVFGAEESARLGDLFERPAPVYLRVNRLKSNEDEVIARLREENYLVDRAEDVPGALMVIHRANLYRSQAFNEGLYEVQDVSSQVVALALDARPGERVLDYCAGAGGKTLHLAAEMENKGLLWALDVDARRLTRLRVRAGRAGAYNIRRGLLDEFSEESMEAVWRSSPRVRIEETEYEYSARQSPGTREVQGLKGLPPNMNPVGPPAGMSPDGPERGTGFSAAGVAGAGGRSGARANAETGEREEAAAIERAEVPAVMRAALVDDVPEMPRSLRASATAAAAGSAKAPKRTHLRANELPEPSEEEKAKLRSVLASIPREFDAVLVDAPCSGTGTCRRRPDFGWRVTPAVVEENRREQASILRAASRHVRPGGRLLYATCSILPEENEDQVLSFLAEHPEFEPADLRSALSRHGLGHWLPEGGAFWLTLLPTRRPGDGFFVALMRRPGDGERESEMGRTGGVE